jgi:hypothetical protein
VLSLSFDSPRGELGQCDGIPCLVSSCFQTAEPFADMFVQCVQG